MQKRFLSVVAGMAAAVFIIFLMETISRSFFPVPGGVDMKNKEALAEMIRNMPVGAFVFLLLAYALGSFGGGVVAGLMTNEGRVRSGIIVGLVVMLGGIMNVMMVPHPLWFTVATFFVYIPFSFLGAFIVEKARSGKSAR